MADGDKVNLFGSNNSTYGSTNCNMILKTKGKIKILYGSKFIDLIKDGKINAESKVIYTVDDVSDIGSTAGIYITSDGAVYLRYRDGILNLAGEVGTTYVSFMGVLETTSDEKYTALNNIGFIYDTLESVDENAVENGIVYIQDLLKLYIIYNGTLSEYQVSLPNPITEQVVILKSGTSEGALVIKGTGIENSIAFDTLYIYVDDSTHFESDGSIIFNVADSDVITISSSGTTINNTVSTNTIQSINATVNSGFRLYFSNGESTLEVDNLVVRNGIDSSSSLILYPTYWDGTNNIISNIDVSDSTDTTLYEVTLTYENEFEVGDILYVYTSIRDESTGISNLVLIPLQVNSLDADSSNVIYVTVVEDLLDETILEDISDIVTSLQGLTIFLVLSSSGTVTLLRKDGVNIDLVESEQLEDATSNDKVITRIGYLTDLQKTENNNEEEVAIEGYGIYSNNAAFLNARYTSDYELSVDDNSSKFASTEWFHKLVPHGSIIMFNGLLEEIPEGWHICDGTEGTPNLIGYFIKGSDTSGTIESYTVTSGTGIDSYSLIFIMKIV